MTDSNPHTYGAGTDLSSLYTIGRNGQPCPKWAGSRDSAGRKAWARGRQEYRAAVQVARTGRGISLSAPAADIAAYLAGAKSAGARNVSP